MQQHPARKTSASGILLQTEHPRYVINHRRITILLIQAGKQCVSLLEAITFRKKSSLHRGKENANFCSIPIGNLRNKTLNTP